MRDLNASIARLQAAYCDAVFERDVEALLCLYDPHVRVFDAWAVWLYQDVHAWRRAVEAWFSSLGADRVKVRFEDMLTFGSPELGLSSAIVTYAAQSSTGEELRSVQNRITWGVRRTDDLLRIVHEHTSAPVRLEDMKAILHWSTGPA
jgi:ketosteroid isomerase-like protein